jgi:hypothetical protein
MVMGMDIMEPVQSILSNDSYHIEYLYVDRSNSERIRKACSMHGFPAGRTFHQKTLKQQGILI